MKHGQRKETRRTRRDVALPTETLLEPTPRARGAGEVKPKTEGQRIALSLVGANQVTFLTGPAGTGKTHCGAGPAAIALRDKLVERIIVTRPNVEAGTPMGFLKGDMAEKYAPYFAPVKRILEKILGVATVEAYIASGKIEIAPVPFLQGHTFENAFVLLDEAQNMSPREMEMFLTRLDDYSRAVISGDSYQRFGDQNDGLADALRRLRGVKGIGHYEFTIDDIVRGGMVREVIMRYRENGSNDNHAGRPDAVGTGTPDFFAHSAA